MRRTAPTEAMLPGTLGADVRVAHNGAAALKSANGWRPDVVFLDLGMPDMDGYDVIRRMRSDAAFAHAHVVALTGWNQEADRRRTAAEGFDGHLAKPVDMTELNGILAMKQPE